ncbi:MAG: DUF3800 domain-containing protein (plasmid) [Nitrospira sp.]
MHGLTKADAEYVFYHDETNNIKKLRLGVQGFNVTEPGVFVLGGVVHDGAPRSFDPESLRNAMHIQRSAGELKLKHVAKGEFLDLLTSDKLTTFLQWISDNDLFVHYHALDPLFWSLVDIMDSILYRLGEPRLMELHIRLKADLTALLRANLPETTSLFYRYNYPDLAPENRKPFLNELISMLEQSDDVLPEFNSMMLKGMLQAGRDLPSLDFIEGCTPHLLIESFTIFYLKRIALFKHSTHILDMEDSIRDDLQSMKLVSGGQPVKNYRFADSKSEPGIQVSDIVVGLIGKMYSYFAGTTRDEVSAARASLIGTSLKNAELLRDIIDASHEANIAFLDHVTSANEIGKMNVFLRSRGSAYE